MTSANMLARVRTLLDEASASFWTDTEIYSALADGQQQVANYFLNLYKSKKEADRDVLVPQPLENLVSSEVATTTTGLVARPADFWHLLSASYAYTGGLTGTYSNCRVEKYSENMYFDISNTYLTATSTNPIVYDVISTGQKFYFQPAVSGTGAYSIYYIKIPTAIASGQEPTLPASTHTAIVHWATSQMLVKDLRPQEAQMHVQLYINEIQAI